MTSDTYDPLLSLAEERERLERLLGADAAWRALKQLEALETQGGAELAASFADLRGKLEAELAGNKVFEARRRISEAISLLSDMRATAAAAPELPPDAAGPLRPEGDGPEGDGPEGDGPEADEPVGTIQAETRPIDRVVTIATIEQRGATAEIDRPAVAPAAPQPEHAAVPADDLTRIRGIDRTMAVALRAVGVARFADIARWSADDVRHISAALGLGRAISRGNWIEQAARLAGGSWQTSPASGRSAPAAADEGGRGPRPASRPIAEIVAKAARQILDRARPPTAPDLVLGLATAVDPAAPSAVPDEPPTTPPAVSPPPPADDLSRLSAMDAAAIDGLAGLGVLRYAEIAGWTATDVRRVRRIFGASVARRSGRWIEEAAILAAGGETQHARRIANSAPVALAAMPDPAATRCDPARAAHLAAESARHSPPPAEPAPLADLTAAPAAPAAPAAATAPPDLDFVVRVSAPAPFEPGIAKAAPIGSETMGAAAVAASTAAEASPPPVPDVLDFDILVLSPLPADEAGGGPILAAAAQPAPSPTVLPARPAPAIHPLEAALPVGETQPTAPTAPQAVPDPTDEPEPDPAPAAAPGQQPDLELIASLDELPLDLVPDIPDVSFGEADVAIVRRAAPAEASADDAALRPRTASGGAGTLQSRLRRAGEDSEIDGRTYAAYHGEVEEASVEIVRRAGPARPRGTEEEREGERPKPPAEGAAADADGRAVRRFLKALTGQSR